MRSNLIDPVSLAYCTKSKKSGKIFKGKENWYGSEETVVVHGVNQS